MKVALSAVRESADPAIEIDRSYSYAGQTPSPHTNFRCENEERMTQIYKVSDNNESQRTYSLLVYGIDKKGLTVPVAPIKRANYSLTFEPYATTRRFNEFDGVILFQGIFEEIEYHNPPYGTSYITATCDKSQQDKRQKELDLLLENRGFVCFLLCKLFIDRSDHGNAKISDLAKIVLNSIGLYRENFSSRVPSVIAKRSEFSPFLRIYGAASTHFYGNSANVQCLATANERQVGFMLSGQLFFVPSLLPENLPNNIEEFFGLLAEALTSTVNKLAFDIPAWVDAFKFEGERTLLDRKTNIAHEMEQLDERLVAFQGFKRVLVTDSDRLVTAVIGVLKDGFKYRVDDNDEYREDLKVLGADGKPILFVEVKGTNSGVKREHVNQADSHRERAKLPPDFGTVLIINTHIKNARTLEEKDKPVPSEQVAHAARNSVVILRTLDLLGLLELVNNRAMSSESVLELLRSGGGWLRAWNSPPELLKM